MDYYGWKLYLFLILWIILSVNTQALKDNSTSGFPVVYRTTTAITGKIERMGKSCAYRKAQRQITLNSHILCQAYRSKATESNSTTGRFVMMHLVSFYIWFRYRDFKGGLVE